MRKLPFVFFLLAALCFCAYAQEKGAACPSIFVKNPTGFIESENVVTYIAIVRDGEENSNLTYGWTVRGGEIIEGQGSRQARIKIDPANSPHEVKVEIKGLPAGCANTVSEAIKINYRPVLGVEVDPSCPAISVTGPSSAIRPGDEMIFAANISNVEPDQVGYAWKVTGGQITRGQGTPVIYVSTAAVESRSITAKVEVRNLPKHCPNSASETASIMIVDPPKLGEYGKLTFRQEKQRLDAVVKEMRKFKGAGLIIITYYPKSVSPAVRKKRALAIQNYLAAAHKISKKNVRVVYGGEGNGRHVTSIYLIPPDHKQALLNP